MVCITDVMAAKETQPITSMWETVLTPEELKEYIPLDDTTYNEEEVVQGYEATQLQNMYL
jgi:hypothetical protein